CDELELTNVECVWSRVERFSALGAPARETFDVVTARALASLPVLIEYAAPLLRVGGSLVAWKGDPAPAELADAAAAESALGFSAGALLETAPFAGSLRRHFYVTVKRHAVDHRYPRRPGTAQRRPIGAGATRAARKFR
ncbi:MAG: class I SAM-dependent methyltransferase, partial [Thermoleophilia bacterium]|nr:class I SAM-dependent methyltransferase [Thermoleophilia bacterium]